MRMNPLGARYYCVGGAAVLFALGASASASADAEPPLCEVQPGLPVFPGAEGFGTTTPAGRGGRVIEVSSFQDDGAGSLCP